MYMHAVSGGSAGEESACHAGDLSLIPGSERSPGEWQVFSSILDWRIPWIEEPGGLQCMESQYLSVELLQFKILHIN